MTAYVGCPYGYNVDTCSRGDCDVTCPRFVDETSAQAITVWNKVAEPKLNRKERRTKVAKERKLWKTSLSRR